MTKYCCAPAVDMKNSLDCAAMDSQPGCRAGVTALVAAATSLIHAAVRYASRDRLPCQARTTWKPCPLSGQSSSRARYLRRAHAALVVCCKRPGQRDLLHLDDRDGLHL